MGVFGWPSCLGLRKYQFRLALICGDFSTEEPISLSADRFTPLSNMAYPSEFRPSRMFHLGDAIQQLHKYYKGFASHMLRSIQAAVDGNIENNGPLIKGTGSWKSMGNATRHLLSR
jgi:hypothetical protein